MEEMIKRDNVTYVIINKQKFYCTGTTHAPFTVELPESISTSHGIRIGGFGTSLDCFGTSAVGLLREKEQ